ncbi:MAG: lyase family protein [Aeromicrobium sp.]
MADLFWPGDERADGLLDDGALLTAMVAVEQAWLDALVSAHVAPASAAADLTGAVGGTDAPELASGAEAGGNPAIGLVAMLRDRTTGETSQWLHRGLTSQDVVDTALVLCLREAIDRVLTDLDRQLGLLADLAHHHRDTVMVGRTLTQHAVPITFGVKVASWIDGLVDARTAVVGARDGLAVQVGGAAGTLAAAVELTGSLDAALDLVDRTAAALGLPSAPPWHTSRVRMTRTGDALTTLADAWGHLAADAATLSRPEIDEVREGIGGGSSTMPHKSNPVLSVLLRRHAFAAPGLASTLHVAAGAAVDERPDGAWHAEWAALRDLGRRSVVAAGQASDLLAGLRVDTDAMSRTLATAQGVDAEQQSMVALTGRAPAPNYLGAAHHVVDTAVARARQAARPTPEEGA